MTSTGASGGSPRPLIPSATPPMARCDPDSHDLCKCYSDVRVGDSCPARCARAEAFLLGSPGVARDEEAGGGSGLSGRSGSSRECYACMHAAPWY